MPEQTNAKPELAIKPWYVAAGDDGLHKDCIMVAVMNGNDLQSISLHLAAQPDPDIPL